MLLGFLYSIPLIQSKEHKIPVKIEQPVEYSYTAIAVAYFDEDGVQQGLMGSTDGAAVGMIPDRFPLEGDRVITDSDRFTILNILGKGTGSSVFRATASSRKDVAIKFQQYERSEREFSVETDYSVLKRTATSFPSYFPEVFYLSGVGSISKGNGVLNLRYLVMELLGPSVWSLVKSRDFKLSIRTAASIGIQVVDILERMHSIGFIHGDIHLENILFVDEGKEYRNGHCFTDRVVLGDYGKSRLYVYPENGQLKPEEFVPIRKGKNLVYLSPYELGGSSYSRREDIYRLIESIARMIDERKYTSKFRPFQNDVVGMKYEKNSLQLSDILPGIHPRLGELYAYARSIGFADRPNYDYLRGHLTEIIHDCGSSYNGKIILD
jgi:serine/threonine protein kinase